MLQDLKKTLEVQYPGVQPHKIVKQPVTLAGQVQLEIYTDVPGWRIVSLTRPCTVSKGYINVDARLQYSETHYLFLDHPKGS